MLGRFGSQSSALSKKSNQLRWYHEIFRPLRYRFFYWGEIVYLEAKEFFENFVTQYDLSDQKNQVNSYSYKYHHTFRVVSLMEEFGKAMNLSKEEQEIALTIAIFHDLGRFQQLEKTKVYDDVITKFDHADCSVKILEQGGWFWKEAIAEEEIRFAIFHHNKYAIANTLESNALFYAKLIRDVDKLVIMQEVCLEGDDSKISSKIMDDFLEEKLLDRHDIKTGMDEKLSYLAFVFDFNFKESVIFLEKYHILLPYFEFLKHNLKWEDYEKIYQTVMEYITKRKKEWLC